MGESSGLFFAGVSPSLLELIMLSGKKRIAWYMME